MHFRSSLLLGTFATGFLCGFVALASADHPSGSQLFSDVTAGSPGDTAIGDLVDRGLVSGYADGRFGPADSVTREQLAIILDRLLTGTRAPAPSSLSSSASSPVDATAATTCRINDLTVSTQLSIKDQDIVGNILLENNGNASCQLPQNPTVQLLDGYGNAIPQTTAQATLESLVLEPKGRTSLSLDWSNGCGAKAGPYAIRISFQNQDGYLSAPLQSRLGAMVVSPPPCVSPRESSRIEVQ